MARQGGAAPKKSLRLNGYPRIRALRQQQLQPAVEPHVSNTTTGDSVFMYRRNFIQTFPRKANPLHG